MDWIDDAVDTLADGLETAADWTDDAIEAAADWFTGRSRKKKRDDKEGEK